MLYLRPKLKYPLSCTTLTATQCKMIQAPALAALLPKLHLNRHSPRAVIFGSSLYGGLGLPDLHVDQGFEQLTLFIGHLKLADENGQMILSLISHLQLFVGSATSFWSLPFSRYIKWVETNWVTSIWWFLSSLRIALQLEDQWMPRIARKGDAAITDVMLQYNFTLLQQR
jgi:hypothetical protein